MPSKLVKTCDYIGGNICLPIIELVFSPFIPLSDYERLGVKWNISRRINKIFQYDIDSPETFLYTKKVVLKTRDKILQLRFPIIIKESITMPEIETTKSVEAKDSKGRKIILFDIEVYRTVSKGFQINVKSERDWSFLARKNENRTAMLGGVKCFLPKQDYLEGVDGYFMVGDNSSYDYDNRPNLGLLLACNLKEGVSFNFGHFPIAKERIETWVNEFKKRVKNLYLTYCNDVGIRFRITSETIETECHDF